MTSVDPIAIAAVLAKILDQIGIRYVIGGSVAASAYGEPRTTLDLDVMIEADERQIRKLVEKLSDDFYVDETAAEHDSFATKQSERRRALTLGPGLTLYFYAPEDLIVHKLMWYRVGGELSERPCGDVIGVLKLSSSILDWGELRRAASEAGVEDLPSRAAKDAEL